MILSRNEKEALAIVRKKGVVSINDIVKSCNISIATGSRLINKLISDEFLTEADTNDNNLCKGRPLRYVKWHCPNRYVIGIDVGTTRIKGYLFNLNLVVIKEVDIETNPEKDAKEVFSKINNIIERLYDTNIIDKNNILGIGVAFAGLINKDNKVIKFSPAFNWHNLDISKYLVNKTNLPLYYENVTRLMALGEFYFGYGKKFENFIFINIGYGIGSSAVLNGKLFIGENGYAGEFGHVIAEPDSKTLCSCGQYGCLTTTSSGDAIAKNAIRFINEGEKSILSSIGINRIDAKAVFDAACNNDELSIRVIDYALKNLAIRIADLKKCFDPKAIIIGGGVSWNGDYFFSNLNKKLSNLNMRYSDNDKSIVIPQSFPGKAASIGAGVMVAQKVLNL